MDLGEISRFADAAAAILTVSAPFRREPPALIRHVRPRIFFESIRLTRTCGRDREIRRTCLASMTFSLTVQAESSAEARRTVMEMFPGAVVTGVHRRVG